MRDAGTSQPCVGSDDRCRYFLATEDELGKTCQNPRWPCPRFLAVYLYAFAGGDHDLGSLPTSGLQRLRRDQHLQAQYSGVKQLSRPSNRQFAE